MTHYIAIVEEEEGKAFGVWFPDLPVCVSDRKRPNNSSRPQPDRTQSRSGDRRELSCYMVALIPFPQNLRQHAAE
jgi:hypothetical protein